MNSISAFCIKTMDNIHILIDSENMNEIYNSRIKKGMYFYNTLLNDICIAEYSPASKVSRKIIAIEDKLKIDGIPQFKLNADTKLNVLVKASNNNAIIDNNGYVTIL